MKEKQQNTNYNYVWVIFPPFFFSFLLLETSWGNGAYFWQLEVSLGEVPTASHSKRHLMVLGLKHLSIYPQTWGQIGHLASALIRKQALGVVDKSTHHKGEIILTHCLYRYCIKVKAEQEKSFQMNKNIPEARVSGNQLSTGSSEAWDHRSSLVWEWNALPT